MIEDHCKTMKYQIVSPTGSNVCIIEAGYVSKEKSGTAMYKDEGGYEWIFTFHPTWGVIPIDAIAQE